MRLHLDDLGDEVPSDLWQNYDFVIVTFDLGGENKAFELAWPLVHDVIARHPEHRVERVVVVGTKRDAVPSDPYDIAIRVNWFAREAEFRQPGLRMVPVSSTTTSGYAELSSLIGDLPVLTSSVAILTTLMHSSRFSRS